MQRFDENATLDRLAPTGRIDAALSDALGRAVAALHARASAVEAEPWIAALADYIEQNDAAFRTLRDLFPPAEVELLTTKSRAAHTRIRPLLLERGHLGLIRRLHGDLHLGNIVLLGGQPVAFDAIEFSALIASATCSTISPSCSWIWWSGVSHLRPTSSSTAISPTPSGPTTSMRSRVCRSFCRCAPPSAPR